MQAAECKHHLLRGPLLQNMELETIVPKVLQQQVQGSKHPVLAVTIALTEAIDEASKLLPQSVRQITVNTMNTMFTCHSCHTAKQSTDCADGPRLQVMIVLEGHLRDMIAELQGCSRIVATPMPFAYIVHLR